MEVFTRNQILRSIVAFAFSALGLAVLAVSAAMGNPLRQPVGPGYLPSVLGVSLTLFSAIEGVVALRGVLDARGRSAGIQRAVADRTKPAPSAQSKRQLHPALVAAALVGGLWLWRRAGYMAGMPLILLSLTQTGGMKLRIGLPFSIALSTGVWLLFEWALGVRLG